jgi:predicted AlkP superfamily pyrophosphatase or phosphodiesterase
MKRKKDSLLSALTIAIFLSVSSIPQARYAQAQSTPRGGVTRAQKSRAATPKLLLMLVVDQFRYDFLERFEDLFGAGGFRRLMSEGAFFTNANYDYVPTFTAPGHAAIFTGSVPAQNGIVGNSWYDRRAGHVRVMVSDAEAHAVTDKGLAAEAGAPSPRILVGTTIGDQIRLATGFQSKVVTMSLKDRSAVLPGGQRPNGAFWFNSQSGTFISSDYYFKELPAWVKRFNATERPDKFFGNKWEQALAVDAYKRAQVDNLAVQTSPLGKKFPYVITGGEEMPGAKFYSAFELTPFALEYQADFARAAIEAESLGADQYTDLLAVSFSTPDLTGHAYGPDSQEVEDIYIRLDRVIADLLSYIDKRIGLANVIITLTGDHGVAPVPEYMKSLGIDADRISPNTVITAANKALGARFGGEKWVLAFVNDQLYLDQKVMAERKADPAEAERIAGDAALAVPGVVTFFTRTQIVEGRMPSTALGRRVTNGFNRLRSGDVWLITKPFSFFLEGNVPLATTHGSAYNYDTHVPVILFGAGVRAGRYNIECSPSDIAPTVAALLGVEQPSNRVGRVLVEAMAADASSRR